MKLIVVMPSARSPKSLESFIKIAPDNVDFAILSEKKLGGKHQSKKFRLQICNQVNINKKYLCKRSTKTKRIY